MSEPFSATEPSCDLESDIADQKCDCGVVDSRGMGDGEEQNETTDWSVSGAHLIVSENQILVCGNFTRPESPYVHSPPTTRSGYKWLLP